MNEIRYAFLVTFAETSRPSDALFRILEHLSGAISECDEILKRAVAGGNEDYYLMIGEEESDVVESLVGTAFVAIQTAITAVVSSVKRIHDQLDRDKLTFPLQWGKENVLRLGSPLLGNTGYSRIQVIEALANYFKHHDEWPVTWSKLNKRHRPTSLIIESIGGKSGSTGNLRTGLEALGIDTDFLRILHVEVSAWQRAVIGTYEAELLRAGL